MGSIAVEPNLILNHGESVGTLFHDRGTNMGRVALASCGSVREQAKLELTNLELKRKEAGCLTIIETIGCFNVVYKQKCIK